MSQQVVLGVDIGTTTTKAEAYTLEGRSIASSRATTAWSVGRHGEAEMDVDRLTADVTQLLDQLAIDSGPDTSVLAIGITGLAETGVVIDGRRQPKHAAMAWFDQRGAQQLEVMPRDVRESFSGVTGLARKAECSLSKLLWLRDEGLGFDAADRWLNAQEYVAMRLTGEVATEPSLASRTGLLAQDSQTPWDAALDLLGVGDAFVPERVSAGTPFGTVSGDGPERLRGAIVCVAGHDHLVGAVGSGALGANELFNSCGTADVLVRSVPWALDDAQRASLVAGGLSAGRHVLADRNVVLGATRFGLVLERVVTMLGASEPSQRATLVDGWTGIDQVHERVSVSEPPNWANEVTIGLHDACTPEQVVSAAINYGLDMTRPLLALIESVVGPSEEAIAGGGWSQLSGVRRAKATLMPGLRLSSADQPGIRGAAVLAALSAGVRDQELTREVAHQLTPSIQREIDQ